MFSRNLIVQTFNTAVIQNNKHVLLLGYCTSSAVKSDNHKNITVETIFSAGNVERYKKALLKASKHKHVNERFSVKNPKQAAVLVPFCLINGEPSVIFTLRSTALSNHGAEVSFPGGMSHHSDTDLVHTAIRETEEEIGLDGKQISIWGQLFPIPGKNWETLVTPVIGYCDEVNLSALKVNHDEVADVFSVTVESLCKAENLKYTRFRSPKTGSYTLPVFVGGRYRIWGLTAVMLHLTLSDVVPGLYTFKKFDLGKIVS